MNFKNFSVLIVLFVAIKTEAQTSVLNLADSLYINGNYSKAIEQYQLYNKPSEVYDKIAKAYMAIGNYDEALRNYKLSIDSNPKDALVKYECAKLLSKTKKFEEASKMFNDLVYLDYKNPNYHYELGLVLEQMEDSTAMNRFRSAYDLDNTHQKAIYKIAKAFVKKRKHAAAEKYINKGLESYENNVELISLKAQNYYIQDDHKNAITWFEKLIALGESSEFIHEKLSLSYAYIYEYEKAIAQRKRALMYNPYDANAIYVIGTYYENLRDYENAEKYVKQALFLKDVPLDHEYQFLGTIYNRQKKYAEAIEVLKTAVKENPENQSAQFFLVRTKDEYYADLDSKIQLYENYITKHPKSVFIPFAERRLKELKEEKFMKAD